MIAGMFGIPGGYEWLVVLVIVLIFFGVGKLPQVLGQMGLGVRAFKDGMNTPPDGEDRPGEIDVTPAGAEGSVVAAEEVRAPTEKV